MIIRIFTAIVISTLIFSCNPGTKKSESEEQKQVSENVTQGQPAQLINLDTAKSMYNILCQDWVLQEDTAGLAGMDENSKFEIPYRSFYFSTNGSFVQNPRNTFAYGNWSFDEQNKMITLNKAINRGKDAYKITSATYKELVLEKIGSGTSLKFISPGKRFTDPADEPFFIENNRWRIKPASPETDAAIHQRLKDNLHFFILYYKSVLAKGDRSVSFWGLPSCFKWYGGGIFLKKEAELKDNWINCFYNRQQAMKAYALADRLLSQKYDWPKGEQNWIKLNLAVAELMYKKIDDIR